MISIIIPSSNGRHLLKECLESVYRQNGVEYEVIVVDNGSTDGTVEFLQENFPQTSVIETPDQIGFSKAINLGIQSAKGDLIATLNNDTVVEVNWLAELERAIHSHPAIGFCASKILFYDEPDKIDTAGDMFTTAGFGYKRGYRKDDKTYYNEEELIFGACAGAALYKKSMLDKIGLFDEDFYAFNEDIDLSFRAQLRGYRCKYVPNSRIYHRVRATFGDDSEQPLYLGYRNLAAVVIKNMPRKLLIRHLPSMLLHLLLTLVVYTYRGQARTLLRAFRDAWQRRKLFIAKRNKIQETRMVTIRYLNKILDKHWIRAMIRLSSWANQFIKIE